MPHPDGPGAPPKKRRKPVDPVRDRPSDPGHGTPPVSHPGGGGGSHSPYRPGTGQHPAGPDNTGTGGISHSPYRPGTPFRPPPAWIIRRQQILKRAGYDTPVDGAWGPRSQAAWAAFTKGIAPGMRKILRSGQLPHGMTIYQGKLTSKIAADAARAIHDARINSAGLRERHFFDEIRAMRSGLRIPPTPAGYSTTGRHNSVGRAHQAEIDQAAGHREALVQASARAERLFGVEGFKAMDDPNFVRHRLPLVATPGDLYELVTIGTLNTTNPIHVEAIQRSVQREGVHVRVTGKFDNQTEIAFAKAYAKERAHDIHTAVANIRKTYYTNGIADLAARQVLGHAITPERFVALMQAGGGPARRLIVRAQKLYEWSTIPLDQYIQQQAQMAYLAKHRSPAPGQLSRAEEHELLGKSAPYLFTARNLPDLRVRMSVALDAQRLRDEAKRAHSDSSFWSTAWNDVTTVVGYPAHRVGQGLEAAHIFLYRNVYAAGSWLNDVSDDNLAWMSHMRVWTAAGTFLHPPPDVTGSPFAGTEAEWRNRGFIDPTTAWIRGQVTYDHWRDTQPWNAALYESIIDPLNFVGGIGVGEKLTTGAARLRNVGARALASEGNILARGATSRVGYLLAVPHWADTGADLMEDIADIPNLARKGFRKTPLGRGWMKATQARSAAMQRAMGRMNADFARLFDDFKGRATRIQRELAKAGERDAERIGPARTIEIEDDQGDVVRKFLSPDMQADLRQASEELLGHLAAENSQFAFVVKWLRVNAKTSLYRTFDRRDGELSQFGRELRAYITERAARYIIDAVAHETSGGDTAKLAEYLAHQGTAYAGHFHPELAERTIDALDNFREVLHDTILPHFDEIARGSAPGFDWWDEAGNLIEDGEHAKAMERLSGFTLDDFVNERKFKPVANPMYHRPVESTVANKMIASEIRTRKLRLADWADSRIWRGSDPERIEKTVARRTADIEAEVYDAWELIPDGDGLMHDTRAELLVPEPYARRNTHIGAAAERRWIQPGPEFVGHVQQLARDLGVHVNILPPGALDEAAATGGKLRGIHTVHVPDPSTPSNYWVALHELGHAANGSRLDVFERLGNDFAKGVIDTNVVDDERRAWEWAMKQARYPLTADVEADMQGALASYRLAFGRQNGSEAAASLLLQGLGASPEGAVLDQFIQAAISVGPSALLAERELPEWQAITHSLIKHSLLGADVRGVLLPKYLQEQGLYFEALTHHQRAVVRGLARKIDRAIQEWKFWTLPARAFAYTIRNRIDNWVKILANGYIDPRAFFNPEGTTLADMQIRPLMFAARVMDNIFGTDAELTMKTLMAHFWMRHGEELDEILGVHGIEIPESLYDDRMTFYGNLVKDDRADWLLESNHVPAEAGGRYARFQDKVWDLLGSRPENIDKRRLYVQAYAKGMRRFNGDKDLAFDFAMSEIDRILFDYSKVTVLESQLKLLWPFVLFWRKNAEHWVGMARNRPWFYADAQRLYDAHAKSNPDLPDWMQRYVDVGVFGGALRAIGADWLADWASEAWADPIQYSSLNAFYRAFKPKNVLLPADQQGWAFVSGLADAFQDVGLGMNPFLRTPGEALGIFNRRSWTTIFPGTQLLQAFSQTDWMRDYFGPDGKWVHAYGEQGFNLEFALEDPVLGAIGATQWQQLTQESFQRYVDLEIANQVAQGKRANRELATEKIRGWLALQGVVAFVGGLYARHVTQTDIMFYKLQQRIRETNGQENIWADLTPDQQEAYKLESFTVDKQNAGKLGNPVHFDHYRAALEGARAFYAIDDWRERQQYLQDNPDVVSIVNPIVGGRIPDSETWVKDQLLILQGDMVQQLYYDVVHNPEFAPDVQSAAYSQLVTPALKAFWASNDTAADRRQDQIRAQYASYMNRAQESYFAIPETDREARDSFLAQHPELAAWWADHNTMADDYLGIIGEANATYRDIYFRIVDSGDWDAANTFLRQHPHIFDFTSAEGRITADGQWTPRSEAQRAYAKVAPLLKVYWELPEGERERYLKANPLLSRYAAKYEIKGTDIYDRGHVGVYTPGGLSQHAKDYLAVKSLLDAFFALGSNVAKEAFLNDHPELRAYFAKYARSGGGPRGVSQHARDYLAVKSQLDAFFALPESERSAYLAKHPEVQAYFDKYGHHSTHASIRSAAAADPEIHARYVFWEHFFALPPDKRPAYIHKHAADAGIFIYGSLSYDDQLRKEQRWKREALATGRSERATAYMHVKPLLDIYFSLKGTADKTLFMQTNPEVAFYFQHYAKHTGIPGDILPLLDEYYRLQPYSDERRQYLDDHPELETYFSRDATPQERAIQRMVEAYFSLPFEKRDDYVLAHPELGVWFDERQRQHNLYSDWAAAFNEADPRMAPYYARYADIIPLDKIKRFQLAWQRTPEAYLTQPEPERQPETPKTGSPRKAGTLATRRDRSPS